MDFNFDTGAIYGGLQTLDVTTLPPLGGTAGVLSLVGTGALTLLGGTTAQRPGTPAAGMFRFNTDNTALEFHNGTSWEQLSVGGGTVTSVGATSESVALTITGSPVTSSGSFTFNLDADLTAVAALSGTGIAVRTAANTWAQRTIQGTSGNIAVTDGNGVSDNPVINLAEVSQANSGNFVKVTLDGFGRVTGNTAVVAADITTLVDSAYVNVSGDTMNSGADLTFVGGGEVLGLPATPSGDTAAASKAYVDSVAAGLSWKQSVKAASVADIDLATGGLLTIDGYTVSAGDRVLVKNQDAADENGIYVAAVGAWARATDMDGTAPLNEFNGAATFVENGTTQADTGWTQVNTIAILGTDPIEWVQYSGQGSYLAGTGLSLSGNVFSLSSPVATSLGGTGLTTAPSNGQLLIGNGASYSLATLTAGTAIGVSNASGSITINNTGVTSLAGTTNEITVSASTGAVTVGLPDNVTVTSSLTVSGLTPNSALYAGAAGLLTSTAALTNGQILVGSTGLAPVAATITSGTGITVTNGAGTITIAADNNGTVTSVDVSGGTTGLTTSGGPVTTSGTITLAGTLATTNGGTGLTSIGTADQFLSVNAGASGLEYKTISAGTGISVTPGANVLTIANTGVTSVAISAPAAVFSVSGSPVTTTGTLTLGLQTQTANTVFAGPSTGADAAPSFRALAYADLPLDLYVENPSTPTAPVATGTNAVAIGSGSTASAVGGIAIGDGSSSRIFGQQAFANGSFATAGDAQRGMYVLRNVTTDNTLTELFLDGVAATQRLVLPDNSLFTFEIIVAARRTDTTGGGAGYRFIGVAKKDSTAGSITFVGTPSKTIIGETNTPWDAAVSVDTTNGAMRVRVTGETSKTIRWVATVTTTEVTN